MRSGAVRRRHAEEEEESVFVSMTDMTVSFLFVVLILLAFFASQINRDDVVPQATHERVLAELDAAHASLEREQAAHDGTRVRLSEAEVRISALQQSILRLEARILELEALLRQERLTSEELRRRLAEIESKLLSLRERHLNLQQELSDEQASHAETRHLLEAARALILELEARIEELERPDPLEEYLSRSALARLRLLQQLREWLKLDFPDLQVVISAEGDALRFQGEGLFRPGSSALRAEQQRIVETIAQRLDGILPCYTLGAASTWNENCNPGLAVIEAVQIEGHKDSDGPDLANLALSTARANATFAAMLGFVPRLVGHLNTREQPVLSVAGYGETLAVGVRRPCHAGAAKSSAPAAARAPRQHLGRLSSCHLRILSFTDDQ